MKVPAILACSIICLVGGTGLGVLGTTYYGPIKLPTWLGGPEETEPPAEAKQGGPKGMGGAKGMGGMAKKGGPGMGGAKGPSAKAQLNSLVTKLDRLTAKPLQVHLDADAKKTVREQLSGLEELDAVNEEDAKQRLDALLVVLADQKEALEAAGFRWPGTGAGPPPIAPNPFRMEPFRSQLKSVQERVAKAGS